MMNVTKPLELTRAQLAQEMAMLRQSPHFGVLAGGVFRIKDRVLNAAKRSNDEKERDRLVSKIDGVDEVLELMFMEVKEPQEGSEDEI